AFPKSSACFFITENVNRWWKYRDKNNSSNNWQEDVVDFEAHLLEKFPKEIASVRNARCPQKPTNNVKRKEATIVHFASTGNNRGEGANNWNKACNDNCFATVF